MRTNRVLGGVVAVIVALATTSAVAASRRDLMGVDPTGPVAAVRAYVSATVEGRFDEAAAWLAPDSGCTRQDFDVDGLLPADGAASLSVDLVGSTVSGDSAGVEAEVRYGGEVFDPFGTLGFSQRVSFDLRNAHGSWRLTGTPWPLSYCSSGG